MDIIKIKALGVLLTSVILSFIFDGCEVLLAEESVGIDGDLAVSAKYLAFFGKNERVDLDHVSVTGHEAIIDLAQHVDDLVLLLTDAKVMGGLAEMILINSINW